MIIVKTTVSSINSVQLYLIQILHQDNISIHTHQEELNCGKMAEKVLNVVS